MRFTCFDVTGAPYVFIETLFLYGSLSMFRRLPLKQLWSWLIVVACNQVGQQRLMATGLLLRILQISSGYVVKICFIQVEHTV